jgi:hypothetical protein
MQGEEGEAFRLKKIYVPRRRAARGASRGLIPQPTPPWTSWLLAGTYHGRERWSEPIRHPSRRLETSHPLMMLERHPGLLATRRIAFALILIAAVPAIATLAAQTPRPRPPRRQPVTPELERTAFADSTARVILYRARAARLSQDSALRAYDAKTFLRFSVGMGVRLAPDKLLMRTEQAARVRWARNSGVWVEPTGRRTGVPMGQGNLDLTGATPIPYFPGRESLWIPSSYMGVVNAEVNEDHFLHPLASGAEAYYRYESGGSITIGLPNGRSIALRELRITSRRADWRAFVGSFWFDVESGSLVRAAYRMATELDFWKLAGEDMHRQLEEAETRAKTDTGKAAVIARKDVERLKMSFLDKIGVKTVEGLFSPVRANLSAVTVEYGLYEGKFWLPKLNVAEGEFRMGFVHVPLKWQESFAYNSVNGADSVPQAPLRLQGAAGYDDSPYVGGGQLTITTEGGAARMHARQTDSAAVRARDDSLIRRYKQRGDSLQRLSDSLHAADEDTMRVNSLARQAARSRALARQVERRREACATDTTYYAGTASRYSGALRTAVRLPCDLSKLDNSPDLPGSIYDNGEQLYGASERDQLLKSLDFDLQPGWGPQWPTWHSGVDLIRYNRVEGLSVGLSATSPLGFGYSAQAIGRIGTADRSPNGELSLSRSNGRATMRYGAFRRLGVANDDWGTPLSFGASLSNLLYGRDEGFYYRTWGAELAGSRDALGPWAGAAVNWRAFVERQTSAGTEPNTQGSLGHAFGNTHFEQNIDAATLTAIGLTGDVSRTFGEDPRRTHLFARARVEGAFTNRADSLGTSGYGRLVLEGTVSHRVGSYDAALTGAAGASAGALPIQRGFFIGGLHTVRGQYARPVGEGRIGDAFWMSRLETGPRSPGFRPVFFYDIGWAGRRSDFTHAVTPLQGAGVGLSLLDGMFRIDASRGIWPERSWRWDVYLGSRF